MESASSFDLFDSNTTGAPAGVPAGAVYVLAVDVEGLRDEGLSLRLGEIGRAESRLAAMKALVLAEVGRRHSKAVAQRIARDELQSSKREAKRDVESAVQLAQLPATSEALESGEIPQGHARLIARASGESNIDEALLVKAANEQPFDEFVKTVRRHQQDCSEDDGQAILDRQRERRSARIFESPETGMFVLSGQFDQITGTRIATALTAKERELWHREDPNARRTPQQRMADALAELVCEPGDGKTQGANLLVIADYDVIKKELINARLADGSPIPIGELRLLARDADILPSIFDAKTQNMWLGRQRRTASEAQRVALMARDEGCVCCKANPLWCKAHHIIWWSKDGPTDLDNLLLVCDDCHKKIHLHGWTVHQHPKTRKYYLKPPNPTEATGQQGAIQPMKSGKINTVVTGAKPIRRDPGQRSRKPTNRPDPGTSTESQTNQPARSRNVNRVPNQPTGQIPERQQSPKPTNRPDPGTSTESQTNQPARSRNVNRVPNQPTGQIPERQQSPKPTNRPDPGTSTESQTPSTESQPTGDPGTSTESQTNQPARSGRVNPPRPTARSTRSKEGQPRRNPENNVDEQSPKPTNRPDPGTKVPNQPTGGVGGRSASGVVRAQRLTTSVVTRSGSDSGSR